MKRILFLAAIFLLVAAVPVEAAITTYYIRYDTTSCRADSNTAMVWAGGDTLDFVTGGDIQLRLLVAAGVELAEVHSDSALTKVRITNAATDGDAVLSFALSGTDKFTMGVDDGDSDKFKIGTTAVGTGTFVTWDGTTFTITGTLALTDGYELNTYAVESDSLTVTSYATFSGATVANLGTVSAATSITSTVFKGAIDGTVGATTPAAATVTTFTSTGIDDNATGEILQITDAGATVAGDFSATDLDGILGSNTAAAATVTTLVANTSMAVGNTTYTSNTITQATGAALNIALSAAAGDDFTVDGTKLVVEGDNGNVGIGTAAPSYPLTLSSGTLGKDRMWLELNNIWRSASNQVGVTFALPRYTSSDYSNYAGARIWAQSEDATHGNLTTGLHFSTRNNSAEVTALSINSSGNVTPGGNKTQDMGVAGTAWDDVAGDDFVNEADWPMFDDRDDLAALLAVKVDSTRIDTLHGYQIIDDNTLPEWIKRRWKKDGKHVYREAKSARYTVETARLDSTVIDSALTYFAVRDTVEVDEGAKIVDMTMDTLKVVPVVAESSMVYKEGEIIADPYTGNPYLSLKMMNAWALGSIKKLTLEFRAYRDSTDAKIATLEAKVAALEKR
uniref:Uncharacterized protein n=3 Tax=viral metagenome TaxID=1070528 RepID=A0A6M3KM90_9ZZZZ